MRFIENGTTERIGYDFYCDIARNMVDGRKANGLTQDQLADACGIKQSRIADMENVKIRFRLPDVEKIAKALGVSVDWLIDAELDSQVGECRYVVWNEKDIKTGPGFYVDATSRRMAFLRIYDSILQKKFRWFEPRDRAIVQLHGIPVTDQYLASKFPRLSSKEKDMDAPVFPEK